jgi:DNA-binding NarL/FixJ family response regulator
MPSWPLSGSSKALNPSKARVLVVQENDLDATLTTRAMQQYGMRSCKRVATAEDGLRELSKSQYEAVLCDYHLPRMNGVEFVAEAKRIAPGARVILFTSATDPKLAAAAIKAGAAECVSKDEFLTAGLINVVQATLRAEATTQQPQIETGIEQTSSMAEQVKAELSWLKASAIVGYQLSQLRISMDDPDTADTVELCRFFLERLIEVFPQHPSREEDSLVSALMERGSSPQEIALFFDEAFARVEADGYRLPFSPSLPVARILLRLVEAYQQALAASAWSSMSNPSREERAS